MVPALVRLLPRTADPDMALEQPRTAARPAPCTATAPHVAGVPEPRLGCGACSCSPRRSSSPIHSSRYPEFLDSVRIPPRRNPSTAELTERAAAEVAASADDAAVLRAVSPFPAPAHPADRHQRRDPRPAARGGDTRTGPTRRFLDRGCPSTRASRRLRTGSAHRRRRMANPPGSQRSPSANSAATS